MHHNFPIIDDYPLAIAIALIIDGFDAFVL